MTYFFSSAPRTENKNEVERKTHVGGLILTLQGLLDGLANVFLDDRVLLACPPIRDLREACGAEMRIEDRIGAPVWLEEYEQVFDAALLERTGEMVHRRLGEVGAKDRRQDVHRDV